jgi:hypothetical protein
MQQLLDEVLQLNRVRSYPLLIVPASDATEVVSFAGLVRRKLRIERDLIVVDPMGMSALDSLPPLLLDPTPFLVQDGSSLGRETMRALLTILHRNHPPMVIMGFPREEALQAVRNAWSEDTRALFAGSSLIWPRLAARADDLQGILCAICASLTMGEPEKRFTPKALEKLFASPGETVAQFRAKVRLANWNASVAQSARIGPQHVDAPPQFPPARKGSEPPPPP